MDWECLVLVLFFKWTFGKKINNHIIVESWQMRSKWKYLVTTVCISCRKSLPEQNKCHLQKSKRQKLVHEANITDTVFGPNNGPCKNPHTLPDWTTVTSFNLSYTATLSAGGQPLFYGLSRDPYFILDFSQILRFQLTTSLEWVFIVLEELNHFGHLFHWGCIALLSQVCWPAMEKGTQVT